MRSIWKYALQLLVIGVLLLTPLVVSASANWRFMDDDAGRQSYIDTNSVVRKGNSVFYNVKTVYASTDSSGRAFEILTMEYIPEQHVMRYYWEKDYDRNGKLLGSYSMTDMNPFGPASSDYTEIQIVDEILGERSSQQPAEQPQVQTPGNGNVANNTNNATVTKFPKTMGSQQLVLARQIKSGIYNDEVDVLDGETGIRTVVLSHPNIAYDGAGVRIKLDNGQFVGFYFYNDTAYFQGDGCQPWQLEGGKLTRQSSNNRTRISTFDTVFFDGGMVIQIRENGKLGVAFLSPSGKKEFAVALPADAHYLTGVLSVRHTEAEIAFYK